MAPRPILVTGFEPFGGHEANASGDAARALDGQTLQGHRVVGLELPCSFARAPAVLHAALAAHDPVLVVALGLAPGRRGFSLERAALNLMDARIPDNDGEQPLDMPVVAGGPSACFTTLPVKAMAAALQDAGLQAQLSLSAGSFVCNQVFYALMHEAAARVGVRAGFVHVGHDLDPARVVQGMRLALAAALAMADGADLRQPGGRID